MIFAIMEMAGDEENKERASEEYMQGTHQRIYKLCHTAPENAFS